LKYDIKYDIFPRSEALLEGFAMARTGISYEQVEQAADSLLAGGRVGPDGNPTLAAVREQLGTGSPNTIHAHLRVWKARRPAQASAGTELPAGVVRAINDELQRATAAARAEIEAKLIAAQTEAAELARAGAATEAELTELQGEHATLRAERDQLLGSQAELQKELERVQTQLELERKTSEGARVDLAQARLTAETQREVATSLRSERDNLRTAIETERAGRIEAERSLAGATAARDTLKAQVDQVVKGKDELERDNDRLEQALDTERTKSADAQRELAACRAESKAASARAEDLARREKVLQDELQQLRTARAGKGQE
jgi:chromosome segregation ATPase